MANDWSQQEVQAIVADYFDMLIAELQGRPFSKTDHRRTLLPQLNGRSEGSIEYKYQNISAVLHQKGFRYVDGYKPHGNYQRSVVGIVDEYLRKHTDLHRYLIHTRRDGVAQLPEAIPRDLLEQAIQHIDREGPAPFGDSTGYDVIYNGNHYPPKAVVGIAARMMTYEDFTPYHFKGGRGSKCFQILHAAGFAIGVKPNQSLVTGPEDELPNQIDDASLSEGDEREKELRAINVRRGQAAFRSQLLSLHPLGCQITGTNLTNVLEAAHIHPYRGEGDNHVSNGLLLRADIHTLFDLHLIGVCPETLVVHIHSNIAHSTYAEELDGTLLRTDGVEPNQQALTEHWKLFRTNAENAEILSVEKWPGMP